jgi:hypothetical protein
LHGKEVFVKNYGKGAWGLLPAVLLVPPSSRHFKNIIFSQGVEVERSSRVQEGERVVYR